MISMEMEDIRRALRGRWCWPAADVHIEGVTIDTRTASAGDAFVAIRGANFDGHDFLQAASHAGCITAVIDKAFFGVYGGERLPEEVGRLFGGGVIVVEDTIASLGYLAAEHREKVACARVVAVTGSNGKTTTGRMIDHILSSKFRGSRNPHSFNNCIGVPLTLLGVNQGDDYVVCEVGSNAPGEIDSLARIVRPDVAVITSVGMTHLAGLGSISQVAAEKGSLLNWTQDGCVAVVNGDSDELSAAVRSYDGRMIRFGVGDECELRMSDYEAIGELGQGCRFKINGHQQVTLPITGRHNATNATAAIAAGQVFGMEQSEAVEALADFPGAQMRQQWLVAGGVTVINDAYNANPSSLAAGVSVLCDCKPRSGGRRVLIVGDMLELGDAAEQLHRVSGAKIAARGVNGQGGVDFLIGVGQLGRYIAVGAREGGLDAAQTCEYDSVEALGGELSGLLAAGDIVLVKGSRAMGMERIAAAIGDLFGAGQ